MLPKIFRTFRAKTIIGIALIEFLLLAFLLNNLIGYMKHSNEHQLKDLAETTVSILASTTTDAVISYDLAALDSFVAEVFKNPNLIYARVIDSNDIVLAVRSHIDLSKHNFSVDSQVDNMTDSIFDSSADIRIEGSLFGRVQIGLDVSNLKQMQKEALQHGITIALLEMIFVAFFSFLLGSYLTRQLKELTSAADLIAEGDFQHRIPVRGGDDLAKTAIAFNLMNEKINDAFVQQQQISAQLKEKTEQWQQKEAQLAYAFAATGEGIWDWDVSTNKVTHNKRWCELLNITDEYQEHQLDYFVSKIHPDDVKQVMQKIQSALQNDELFSSTHRLQTDPDNYIWVEDIGRVVEWDKQHKALRMVGSIRDISVQREIELKLQHEKDYLKTILATSPVGVGISIGSQLQFANPFLSDFLGVQAGHDIRKIFVHSEDKQLVLERISKKALAENLQFQVYNQSGLIKTIILNCYPILYQNQPATLGWIIDVTSLKETQEQFELARDDAQAANIAKSEFLANMSHEIRTPMNAILGMSHLALGSDMTTPQHNYVNKINQAAKNLLNIINDILDFSKIEAGRLTFEHIPFDLSSVFENIASVIANKADEKYLEIIFDVPLDLPMQFRGDPLRLQQVLINLLSNAVKFTEQGQIIIHVKLDPAHTKEVQLHFSVKDSGIGISKKQQKLLFQSFSQGDGSITRRYGGTGLGLVISKKIVTMMGGEIWLESIENIGTTFHFTVKLQKNLIHKPSIEIDYSASDFRILLIEPNNDSREILIQALEQKKLAVDWLVSQQQAFIMIESLTNNSLPWEMIILASNEDYADTDDLCAVLTKKISPLPLPPIILLTNSNCDLADQEKHEQVLVLTKPLLAAYLVDEIFLFRISKNHTRTEQKKQQLIEKQESKSMSGVHLLVAEDNEMNQEVIQLCLQELDVQVTLVNNGQEALEQLEQDSFDGILMDCMMPVMDGYTATRKIRENSKYRDLPIIAVTANAMQRDHKLALASGMNDHIAKPIEFNKLVDVLNQWIKPPKSGHQHFEKHITDVEKTVEAPLLDGIELDGIELDGIDTQKGLSLYLNDWQKYLAFMHRFADKNKHFNADFMTALEKDDSETVILAHSLKGLAAQIGATELSLAAQQLESVSKDSTDKNQIINSLALLQPELERVLSSISSLQPLDKLKAPVEPINKEKLAHTLASLEVFLLEDDTEALDLLDQLVNIFQDNSCLKDIKTLKKIVDKFDFDAAFIQFKKLKPSLEKYL